MHSNMHLNRTRLFLVNAASKAEIFEQTVAPFVGHLAGGICWEAHC